MGILNKDKNEVPRGASKGTAAFIARNKLTGNAVDTSKQDDHAYYHHPTPKTLPQEPGGGFFSRPFRGIFKKEEAEAPERSVASSHYTPRAYVSRVTTPADDSFSSVRNEHGKGNAENGASGNAVGWFALGSTAPAIAVSAMTGTLLPALLITSGVTGVVVAYQYFTRTGLFEEPQLPMELARVQANMPAQQTQEMIPYERVRPQPEIEVPRTPSNTEKRMAMIKKPEGPAR